MRQYGSAGEMMPNRAFGPTGARAICTGVPARLAALVALALALGACSKCDVPDFSHWWGSAAPAHSCE